jgi:hypothetical protein
MATPDHWFANYPPRGSNFERVIDEVRCRSVASGDRRCQLYAGHDVGIAHAYAWREPRGSKYPPGRGRPLPPFHVLRWDESSEWPDDANEERLPWCALQSD